MKPCRNDIIQTLISKKLSFSGAGSGSSHGGGHGSDEGTIWLCKICGEQREMWKKSGAWFFKVSFLCMLHMLMPLSDYFLTVGLGLFLSEAIWSYFWLPPAFSRNSSSKLKRIRNIENRYILWKLLIILESISTQFDYLNEDSLQIT